MLLWGAPPARWSPSTDDHPRRAVGENGSPRCGACAHRLSHDASAAYATVRRERPRARSGNVPIGGRLNRTPASCVVTAYRRIRCVRRSHGRDWHRDRGSLASDRPTPLSKELAARVVSLDRGDPRRTGSRDRPPVRGTDQPVHGARRADGLRHCACHGNRRPGRWARPGSLGVSMAIVVVLTVILRWAFAVGLRETSCLGSKRSSAWRHSALGRLLMSFADATSRCDWMTTG